MNKRIAQLSRRTAETDITVTLNIDGTGKSRIDTGCGFLNHMLTLFASHGLFDLDIVCKGDAEVDFHHTTEDIGIVLGEAFRQALGEKRGIRRYGSFLLPMDEALVQIALDISGRDCLTAAFNIQSPRVGDFDTELGEEFFAALCRGMGLTLHITQLAGRNAHHILEAAFKGTARALRAACEADPRTDAVPSTKGVL